MRLIDADDLYRKVVGYNGGAVDKTVAKRLIEQQPTVQRNSTQSNASNTLNALDTTLNALDTIYRQAAIEAMCSACGYDCDKSEFIYDAPQDEQVILCPEHYALTVLPSAQPERKKGKWIKDGNKWMCDKCGELVYDDDHNFCPNCGCEMER